MKHNTILGKIIPILFTLYFLDIGNSSLQAQIDRENQVKYWKYRYRLVGAPFLGDRFNDLRTYEGPGFIDIGLGQGQSLPSTARFNERDAFNDCCNNQVQHPDANCAAMERGVMQWSDATVHLGQYIGVLATEYALLTQSGQATQEVLQELDLALDAYIRLDMSAETVNPFFQAGTFNGFFLRDDVPESFRVEPSGCPDFRFPGTPDLISQFTAEMRLNNNPVFSVENGTFASGDQMIHLLMGLALTVRLVPQQILNAQGISINQKAQSIVYEIGRFVGDNNWDIIDPDGNIPPAKWGGRISYSGPMADAISEILGSPFYQPNGDFFNRSGPIRRFDDDANNRAFNAVDVFWRIQCEQIGGGNQSMALILAAIGDIWTANTIARKAQATCVSGRTAGLEPLALLHAVLHNQNVGQALEREDFQTILLSAPCMGPTVSNRGEGNFPGWMSVNRLMKPSERNGKDHVDYNDQSAPAFIDDYNGLDYMLFYNLYHLTFGTDPYQNIYEEVIQAPTNHFFETTLISHNEIRSSARSHTALGIQPDVTYEAREYIRLEPGFRIREGHTFYGFINPDPVRCTSNGSDNQRIQELETTEGKAEFKEHDINIYPNPFHSSFVIDFELGVDTPVSIDIFDLSGKKIRTLIERNTYQTGSHKLKFEGSNLAQGVYVCVIQIGNKRYTKKIIK